MMDKLFSIQYELNSAPAVEAPVRGTSHRDDIPNKKFWEELISF
jgi:hypothetical protein